MEDVDAENETAVGEVVGEVVSELVPCLSEELKNMLNRKRLGKRVGRRERMGASTTKFRELALEDPLEYKKSIRMSVLQFQKATNGRH